MPRSLRNEEDSILIGNIEIVNYVLVCMHSDMAYIVVILSKYLSNPNMDH